jgi:ketosteroid isomerase-like protein
MHPHEAILREFFAAFARRDGEAMARCYHDDIFFTDPVFPALRHEDARDMWRMLTGRAKDLEVTLEEAWANEAGGRARWTARYTFTHTGRKVVNEVESMFAFRDGRIVRHYDRFSMWRWATQAFGLAGRLLGWSQPFKWKVRKNAARALELFRERR